MFERFPKKPKDDDEHDPAEELTNEDLEKIAEEAAKMTPDERMYFTREEIAQSQNKMHFQQERVAHLNAQIENLKERLRSLSGAEKEFIQKQLDEKIAHRDEYSEAMAELEEDVAEGKDVLDNLEQSNKKHFN